MKVSLQVKQRLAFSLQIKSVKEILNVMAMENVISIQATVFVTQDTQAKIAANCQL